MKFVIVGFGRVGSRTARILKEEGHDVAVIDIDPTRVERATERGFVAVEGDGGEEPVLEEAGIADADAIGALTPNVNINFAACMVAKHYGARTVLRLDEDYRSEIYKKYATDVDEIVYPERLGAAGAKTAMLGGDFNVVAAITEQLQITTIRIPEGSPAVGKRVSELDLPSTASIYAHGRHDEPLTIPLPGTELEGGDHVAVIAETETMDAVREALVGEAETTA